MPAVTLTHVLGPGGQLDACWGFGDGRPAWAQVPGSADGRRIALLRSWDDVLFGLRHRDVRIDRGYAIGGVTLQHDDGLLRKATGEAREVVSHLWRHTEAERYRPGFRALAITCAGAVRGAGSIDLSATFVRDYVLGVAQLIALLSEKDADRLADLSGRTTGALLPSPRLHRTVRRAWRSLYQFTGLAVDRARRCPGSLMGDTIAAWDAAGMRPEAVHRAATTVYNGIPTIERALRRILLAVLGDEEMLAACRDSARIPGIVRRCLITAVFTFDLPGLLTRPLRRDGRSLLPAGTPVLPVPAAAHADPRRPRGGHLAWGSGIHRCLGADVAAIALEEALGAVASLPGIGLAGFPENWLEGTMPVPSALPVVT